MTHHFGKLPVVLKLSALSVGVPLFLFGVGSMVSDLALMIRSHNLMTAPHTGLELGPVFALVGLSFLWPLRPIDTEDR